MAPPVLRRALAGLLLAASAAPLAAAATLVGLTAENQLVLLDSATLQAAPAVPVRGAEGRLLGIDRREADGRLYGVTDTGQIVALDAASGAASPIARLSRRFESGGRAAVDFDPETDRLRLLGLSGANLRVHPETGEVTQDARLHYGPGPWAGLEPGILAAAHAWSGQNPHSVTLYTVDGLLRQLNRQAPPEEGQQQPLGEIASVLPESLALDIQSAADGRSTAWMLAGDTLFTLSLEDGAARPLGPVSLLPPAGIIDIAVLR